MLHWHPRLRAAIGDWHETGEKQGGNRRETTADRLVICARIERIGERIMRGPAPPPGPKTFAPNLRNPPLLQLTIFPRCSCSLSWRRSSPFFTALNFRRNAFFDLVSACERGRFVRSQIGFAA